MTGGRRIIAVQAVVVLIMVLAVYLTLLRPESTSPLHEVDSAGGAGQPTPAGGDGGGWDGGGTGSDGDRGGDTERAGKRMEITPAGDQYADAVSVLLSRAGASAVRGPASSEGTAKTAR